MKCNIFFVFFCLLGICLPARPVDLEFLKMNFALEMLSHIDGRSYGYLPDDWESNFSPQGGTMDTEINCPGNLKLSFAVDVLSIKKDERAMGLTSQILFLGNHNAFLNRQIINETELFWWDEVVLQRVYKKYNPLVGFFVNFPIQKLRFRFDYLTGYAYYQVCDYQGVDRIGSSNYSEILSKRIIDEEMAHRFELEVFITDSDEDRDLTFGVFYEKGIVSSVGVSWTIYVDVF